MDNPTPLQVLLVDDEEDIRTALRQMLEELEEMDIVEAGDGMDALRAMSNTTFDLLLLDINLPQVNGVAVLESLNGEHGYNRPGYVVVMSAESNLEQLKVRLEAAGVDKFLSKPFRYQVLQEIVADAAMPDLLGDL